MALKEVWSLGRMDYVQNTKRHLKNFKSDADKLICEMESLGAVYFSNHKIVNIDNCPEFVFRISHFRKLCNFGLYIQYYSKIFQEEIVVGLRIPKFETKNTFYSLFELELLTQYQFSQDSLWKIHKVKSVFKCHIVSIGTGRKGVMTSGGNEEMY